MGIERRPNEGNEVARHAFVDDMLAYLNAIEPVDAETAWQSGEHILSTEDIQEISKLHLLMHDIACSESTAIQVSTTGVRAYFTSFHANERAVAVEINDYMNAFEGEGRIIILPSSRAYEAIPVMTECNVVSSEGVPEISVRIALDGDTPLAELSVNSDEDPGTFYFNRWLKAEDARGLRELLQAGVQLTKRYEY